MSRNHSKRLQKYVGLLYFSFSAPSLLLGVFSTGWDRRSPKVEAGTVRGFIVARSLCCKLILPDATSDFFSTRRIRNSHESGLPHTGDQMHFMSSVCPH